MFVSKKNTGANFNQQLLTVSKIAWPHWDEAATNLTNGESNLPDKYFIQLHAKLTSGGSNFSWPEKRVDIPSAQCPTNWMVDLLASLFFSIFAQTQTCQHRQRREEGSRTSKSIELQCPGPGSSSWVLFFLFKLILHEKNLPPASLVSQSPCLGCIWYFTTNFFLKKMCKHYFQHFRHGRYSEEIAKSGTEQHFIFRQVESRHGSKWRKRCVLSPFYFRLCLVVPLALKFVDGMFISFLFSHLFGGLSCKSWIFPLFFCWIFPSLKK